MATNTQLARIIAPNINDPNYVDSLANAFEVINSNFKKVASLPFLQGVQGDSYRVIEKPIWTDSWNLTKEGAILLNSIFNDQDYQFYEGEPFAASGRTGVTNSNRAPYALPRLGDYCPADFWKGTDGRPINNSLYFQVVIDDTGAEVDESKVLGQFYYFVDARLKSVGNVFHSDSSNSLSAFNDYSGFYRYVPVKINGELITEPEHYEKADLLPSIYYDATRNDICWKFNGMETGISAIGAKGSDGADATISYVRVDTHQDPPAPSVDIHNTLSAYVNGVFNSKNLSDSNNHNDWAEQRTPLFDSIIKKGFAIICFTDFGEHHETDDTRGDAGSVFAIGYIDQKSSNNEWWAYWSEDSYMNRLISFFTINDYFETLGINGPNNGSSAIKFPSIGNAQDNQNLKNKHTIGTAYNGSDDRIEGKKRPIIFRNVDCTSSGDQRTTYNQSEHQAVVLDNYQLKLQPYTGSSADSVGKPDITKENIVINNKQIDFYENPNSVSPSTSITKDSAYFGGTLQAIGDVTLNAFNGTKTLIKGETTIKGDTVIGSTDRTNNLTVHGAATIDTKLKVSGDFEAKGNTELWCSYITMKTSSGSGNIFRGIKVEKDGTRERHFDISSDVIGISRGPWDSGGVKLYVDGDIETIHSGNIQSAGNIKSLGTIEADDNITGHESIITESSSYHRDHIKFGGPGRAMNNINDSSSSSSYWHLLGVPGKNQNPLSDQFGGTNSHLEIRSKKVTIDDEQGQNNASSEAELDVYGTVIVRKDLKMHNSNPILWPAYIQFAGCSWDDMDKKLQDSPYYSGVYIHEMYIDFNDLKKDSYTIYTYPSAISGEERQWACVGKMGITVFVKGESGGDTDWNIRVKNCPGNSLFTIFVRVKNKSSDAEADNVYFWLGNNKIWKKNDIAKSGSWSHEAIYRTDSSGNGYRLKSEIY